ncbi:hypothetical protein BDV98DRAFT_590036 [Pterulicium gracile]|uniref:RING-type domain-containing protein n=1 Tax=Pterulicium gracile TaxID=1884261 RepID=A0A5C3QXU9_9AGAR|nr:hypothetical protein BDV98DRAFT_590036 [Pterula gracilis]
MAPQTRSKSGNRRSNRLAKTGGSSVGRQQASTSATTPVGSSLASTYALGLGNSVKVRKPTTTSSASIKRPTAPASTRGRKRKISQVELEEAEENEEESHPVAGSQQQATTSISAAPLRKRRRGRPIKSRRTLDSDDERNDQADGDHDEDQDEDKENDVYAPGASSSCSNTNNSSSQTSDRNTYARLERQLLAREQSLDMRLSSLEIREAELCDREKALEATIKRRRATAAYQQLQDHFTCAMCFDALSDPHSFSSCGHAFCALCALKHFFSRLHEACGSWHEHVDCPVCRCPLLLPEEKAPRHQSTFPFVRCFGFGQLVRECVIAVGDIGEGMGEPEMEGWRVGGADRVDWEKKSR